MQLRKASKRSLVLNVTSLIDVLFLLLIFFMVSTTFLSTPAIKLELPKARHADPVRQNPLVVYMDAAGKVYVNDEPVDLVLLEAALASKLRESEDKAVILKADSRVTHGQVVQVMDMIKGAGGKRLELSTQPEE
jgi:biopolymer transport protein ExbD